MYLKNKQFKILIIDEDLTTFDFFKLAIEELGYGKITFQSNTLEAMKLIEKESFDGIFLEIQLKSSNNGLAILKEIKKNVPETPVVIISSFDQCDENMIKAVEIGATQILEKPFAFSANMLRSFLRIFINYHTIRAELREIKERFYNLSQTCDFMTQSKPLLKNMEMAERVADSDISVIILGESGTGKELVAEFIHKKSNRSDKPLIKVNCAAIPEGLLESELFGHVKGAFTGAIKDRKGKFELADEGTLFLDEIGDMPFAFQAKLLRVLQNKEFERVGDTKTKKVNVRVLSATNINIDAAIQEKTFREDLFYRLNGFSIKILALRERPEDIELLVHHFIQRFSKEKKIACTKEALFILKAYSWRGNVRELENVIHRAVLLAKDNIIDTMHLPDEIKNPSKGTNNPMQSLEEMEKIHIAKVLSSTPDFPEAAKILKIDLATLWRKRKRYSI